MQNVKSIIFFSRKFCFAALLPVRPIDPAPNSLPSSNSRAKQPRNTDRELRSSSFPFAVPISRSVSSRSPYQFVVCWPSVRHRTGSPLGSSTDLHQVLFPINFRSPPSVRRQGRSPPSVESSYRTLRRPIVRCFVQTRARSWRRRTRDASPIARSGGGAKGRKKLARWNRESHDLY